MIVLASSNAGIYSSYHSHQLFIDMASAHTCQQIRRAYLSLVCHVFQTACFLSKCLMPFLLNAKMGQHISLPTGIRAVSISVKQAQCNIVVEYYPASSHSQILSDYVVGCYGDQSCSLWNCIICDSNKLSILYPQITTHAVVLSHKFYIQACSTLCISDMQIHNLTRFKASCVRIARYGHFHLTESIQYHSKKYHDIAMYWNFLRPPYQKTTKIGQPLSSLAYPLDDCAIYKITSQLKPCPKEAPDSL